METSRSRPRILIVEDDPSVLRIMCLVLEPHYELVTGTTGSDGLQLATDHQPDLILTDMALPGMQGDELVRRIREVESLAAIPILAVTGSIDTMTPQQLRTAGVQDCLLKPFGASELLQKVREWIRQAD